MALSLTIVALAAAALLGGLYTLTKEPIDKQKAEKQQKAILSVLPVIDGMEIAEPVAGDGIIIYSASKDGQLVGSAVQTEENGFGGKFKVMVGFDAEGNIAGYEVLEHQETPGLGDHMTEWFKNADKEHQNIIGKSPATTKFEVSKDGGEVDAITAATISSRAFLKAVQKAYDAAIAANNKVDAASSATAITEKAEAQEWADAADKSQNPENVKPVKEESHE